MLFSDEIYFLIHNPDLNIKLRHNLIDIKKRLSIDSSGLEKWTPILKVEFPIIDENRLELFKLLELDLESSFHGSDVKAFVKEISGLRGLETVHISKERSKYEVHGVSAEVTRLSMNRLEFATIAMEHENIELIQKAKKELGINIHSNENYPTALKRYKSLN